MDVKIIRKSTKRPEVGTAEEFRGIAAQVSSYLADRKAKRAARMCLPPPPELRKRVPIATLTAPPEQVVAPEQKKKKQPKPHKKQSKKKHPPLVKKEKVLLTSPSYIRMFFKTWRNAIFPRTEVKQVPEILIIRYRYICSHFVQRT